MGGYSSEHGISIKSGNVVYKYLDRDKYHPYRVVITREKWFYLDENNREFPMEKSDFSLNIDGNKIHFDCVFNAIHGTPGEDGLMQAYFELLGIRHTSCNHYEAALTFNKRDLLSTLKSYGVPCAQSYFLNKGQDVDEDAIVEKVGLPCFVKANRAGSSYGVSKVYQKEELGNAIENAFKEDTQIIIESFLDGTEVSVGVITYENKVTVLPATEIISENDFFDYDAKYNGKSQEITPARLDETTINEIHSIVKKLFQQLELQGVCRSEFIIVEGTPHLLEVNTIPGLTPASLIPQQVSAAGIELAEFFESLLLKKQLS